MSFAFSGRYKLALQISNITDSAYVEQSSVNLALVSEIKLIAEVLEREEVNLRFTLVDVKNVYLFKENESADDSAHFLGSPALKYHLLISDCFFLMPADFIQLGDLFFQLFLCTTKAAHEFSSPKLASVSKKSMAEDVNFDIFPWEVAIEAKHAKFTIEDTKMNVKFSRFPHKERRVLGFSPEVSEISEDPRGKGNRLRRENAPGSVGGASEPGARLAGSRTRRAPFEIKFFRALRRSLIGFSRADRDEEFSGHPGFYSQS